CRFPRFPTLSFRHGGFFAQSRQRSRIEPRLAPSAPDRATRRGMLMEAPDDRLWLLELTGTSRSRRGYSPLHILPLVTSPRRWPPSGWKTSGRFRPARKSRTSPACDRPSLVLITGAFQTRESYYQP